MQLVDEDLEHWPLALEHMYVRRFLSSDLLLDVIWEWLLVELSHECEALEILILGWSVLVDAVVDDTGNHSNLICVVLRPTHLGGKGQRDKGWTWFVDILDRAGNVLWDIHLDFMLAPGTGALSNFYRVLDSKPAWTLNFELEDKQLQHALVSTEDVLESVS